VVGAGATGSELLKDFAMCGVGTGKWFNVVIADDDIVERSNLSRQFLYRSSDIKNKKAVCAAAAASVMNSDFKVRGYAQRVDENTPSTFGANCDVTVMAVDSDVARSVVAQRCQYAFRQPQPCLNLGTSGLSLSTDSIIPHVTTSYSSMRAPSAAPQEMNCQERTVPRTIRHCISLAKRQFELLFVGLPKDEEPLSLTGVRDWNECVIWARMLFDWCNESWVEDVKRQWPASDPIWQGRALPRVVEFDHMDELVQQFVGSAAVLKSVACRITAPAEMRGQKNDIFAAIAQAASTLPLARLTENAKKCVSSITCFEKDDDTNFHVDFVASCANLKARMFHVTPCTCKLRFPHQQLPASDSAVLAAHFEAKVEAGGIVPAVSTATSVASALTCLDVFRVALHKRAPGSVSFPGRFLNLGHIKTTFSTFEACPPKCSTIAAVSGEFRVRSVEPIHLQQECVADDASSGLNGTRTWQLTAQ
jgi:molybdopterin/thiamine biosynthesis adenylyltransferase